MRLEAGSRYNLMGLCTGSRYNPMKIVVIIRLVTRDVVNEFAGMGYGLVVDCRTHTNTFGACVCWSSPQLTEATQSHSTAASKSAKRCLNEPSGVRYTDDHYTCSTADIRALRAAGYDSSSSRQTIRCQRRAVVRACVRAVQRQHKHEDRLQPDAPHARTSAFSRRRPLPASFEAASANLHIISGGSSSTRRRRC